MSEPKRVSVRYHGKHLQVYPETHAALKLLAALEGISLAEAAHRAIEAALEESRQKHGTES
jgi:hypothetical protein